LKRGKDKETGNLASFITIENLMEHLQDLEDIAYKHNGSRAIEFGYNASLEYVLNQIREHTNFQPTIQYFNVSIFEDKYPPSLIVSSPFNFSYIDGVDFLNMGGYDGVANLTANISIVADLGCSQATYSGFVANNIALVKRGNCTFADKIFLAKQNNAAGILIYNDGVSPSRVAPFLGNVGGQSPIPVFSISFVVGQVLHELPPHPRVSMFAHQEMQTSTTMNLIVDTPFGREDRVIVVGSHLDSVKAGPGINDNGSGSSANLELAIQLYQSGMHTYNKIRFCWWGAEEIGLLGSEYYVRNLNETDKAELAKIALNLNFDMIGSPNYQIGLHNGSEAPASCVKGSVVIQVKFEDFLNESGIPFEYVGFDGRSDYGPFIAAGIPAGGLFTGAEVVKSPEERELFGGFANAEFDPCYHQSCDTVQNINQGVYIQMAQVAASTLEYFAFNEELDVILK